MKIITNVDVMLMCKIEVEKFLSALVGIFVEFIEF